MKGKNTGANQPESVEKKARRLKAGRKPGKKNFKIVKTHEMPIESLTDNEIRDRLRRANQNRKAAEREVGELLLVVFSKGLYKKWRDEDDKPFGTFENYAKSELDINPRMAYQLKRVWEVLHVQLGMAREEVLELPWTKADVITAVANKDNVHEWAERCKEMSVTQLRAEVDKVRRRLNDDEEDEEDEDDTCVDRTEQEEAMERRPGKSAERPPQPKPAIVVASEEPAEREPFEVIQIHVAESQKDVIDRAIEKAKKRAKSDHPGRILELICLEWLAGSLDDEPENLKMLLNGMRRCYEGVFVRFKDKETATKVLKIVAEDERIRPS